MCINDLNKDGCICKGFGCNIGDNKHEISQKYAMEQLIRSIKELNNDCPCKTLCIFSGPLNQ